MNTIQKNVNSKKKMRSLLRKRVMPNKKESKEPCIAEPCTKCVAKNIQKNIEYPCFWDFLTEYPKTMSFRN
jgi:hypothetical protein